MRGKYLLAVIWFVVVLGLFYVVHKALSVEAAQALASSSAALLLTLILTAISGGLGRSILRRWLPGWQILSAPEQIAGEALLGLGLLSILMLVMGMIWLHAISIMILLVIIAIVTLCGLGGWLALLWRWIKSWSTEAGWERWLAEFIALNLIMMLVMVIAPPTRFDALTYHLVGPKLWVQAEQFISLPNNHFFAFPQGVHTLYAAHIALMGGQFAGTASLHTMFGLLTLIAIGGYGMRRYQVRVGLMAVVFMLAATSIWYILTTPYIDGAVMAYATLALLALDQWRTTDQSVRWIILAGAFGGLALGVKYEAVVIFAPMGMYMLVYGWQHGLPFVIRQGVVLGAIALLLMAPWLIRTWLFYDNPVYPFGAPAGEWDALSSTFYFRGTPGWWAQNWWQFALLPITATMIGIEGAGGFDFTITPLYLLLLPLFFLTWRYHSDEEKGSIRGWLLVILAGMVAWLLMTLVSEYAQYTRRHLYLLPWLSILAAVALERLNALPKKPFNLAFIARSMVGLVLVLTLLSHISGTRPKAGQQGIQNTTMFSHFLETRSLEYLFGVIDQQQYLEHNLGWYAVAIQQVNDLPNGAKVLFMWETRSLYCDESEITCIEDTILMHWWHDRRTIGDGSAAAIVESWRDQGITHVLVWHTGRDHEFDVTWIITEEDKQEWAYVPPLLDVIWQGEDIYTLYQLPATDAPSE